MVSKKTKTQHAIADEAAEWLVALSDEPEDRECRAFKAWLLRSPVHVEEFLRLSALHEHLKEGAASWEFSLEEILSQSATNVVPLDEESAVDYADNAPLSDRSERRPLRAWWRVAASTLAASIVVVSLMLGIGPQSEYVTAIGEQRSVVLADGSVIELNTQSRVRVKLTEELRHVRLLKGEAIFQVAEDPARPFVVESENVRAEALGTRFNVYRQTEQVVVTVLEGKVAVTQAPSSPVESNRRVSRQADGSAPPEPARAAPPPLELVSGERVAVASNGVTRRAAKVDAERATAWTERRLIFDNEPLELVIGEFNRYNARRLILTDDTLGQRRITGVFHANKLGSFVAFLDSIAQVEIIDQPDGSRLVRSRADIAPSQSVKVQKAAEQ